MAYATNNWGRINIHLKNLETGICKTVFKYGWRTRTMFTDLKLPLLAFTPKGDKLTMVYSKRAVDVNGSIIPLKVANRKKLESKSFKK